MLPLKRDWDQLEKIMSLEFKAGINVLVGPNGSGKSTVLELLSKCFCCYATGIQKVVKDAVWDLGFTFDPGRGFPGITIEHSGDQVCYHNPDESIEKTSYFVGGCTGDQVNLLMSRGSAGESANIHLHRIMEFERNSKNLEEEGTREWKIEELLRRPTNGRIKNDFKTLLFDEIDRSLDQASAITFWTRFPTYLVMNRIQLIVATHSALPFLLFANGSAKKIFNFIELEDGYVDKIMEELECMLKGDMHGACQLSGY
jgi:hypothetical protein